MCGAAAGPFGKVPWFRSIWWKPPEPPKVPKRLEIVVRNPGFEGTESAIGAYTIDLEDAAFQTAYQELHSKLLNLKPDGYVAIAIVRNGRGDERGVNLQYYLSHEISEIEGPLQAPKWTLRGHGESPPPREG